MSADRVPSEPEFRRPQRARIKVTPDPEASDQYWTGAAWVRLDGDWVHTHCDETEVWQTWPAHAVHWIEWEGPR